MKISTKAAIFSTIVFPGAGYFIVGKKQRGFIALVMTLAALSVVGFEAYYKVQIILEQILSGAIPIDPIAIQQLIQTMPDRISSEIISYISISIGLVWFIGIADSYYIGRKMDVSTQ